MFCFCLVHTVSVSYCAHLWVKCSLGISSFLEEMSSLSHSILFLYFFALITEEDFLISPCYVRKVLDSTGIPLCVELHTQQGAHRAWFSLCSFEAVVQTTAWESIQCSPLPLREILCCSPWQFLQIRTQTLLQVGLGPGLDGHAMAELRSVRHQSGVTHSGSLLLQGQ